jgi:cellulose synthase/poly-beta-1,6-N-acetylglucosamine synthase-like glycosyltransferase
VIAYVFFGYPLLFISGLLGRRKRIGKAQMLSSISLLIPAHNEEPNIDRKLRNLLPRDTLANLWEILILRGSDLCPQGGAKAQFLWGSGQPGWSRALPKYHL